jgi:hypothetical protein
MNNKKKTILCDICGKYYSSRQSLYNHKRRMHKEILLQQKTTFMQQKIQHNTTFIQPKIQHNTTLKKCTCKYCNKEFSFSQSKYNHEKKCKMRPQEIISKTEHLQEIKNLKDELTEHFTKLIKENYQLKSQCIEQSTINSNNGDQLNDNAIGTQNNITIVQLGKEDVLGTISQDEKLKILNERYKSVLSLIKLMHCSGKYPQFNNSLISNLKSDFALTYDENENKFITTKKSNLVSDIVSYRAADVEELLDENKEKVSEQTNKKVKELIDILDKDELSSINKCNDFIREYKTKVMTNIYDNREELKQKIKELKII